MIRYPLENIEFNRDNINFITCALYEGSRPAYNFLPYNVISEIEGMDLTKDLSLVLVENPSLRLLGFVTVKVDNYNGQPKGVRIHSIGYCNKEAFHCIIKTLKNFLSYEVDSNGNNLYDYLWGYEFEDYSLIEDEFVIDNRDNIFIAKLH